MDPTEAYLKLEKVADHFEAEAVMLRRGLEAVRGAQEQDKVARGRQGAVRNTQGLLYDPDYQETHITELAERKERERLARQKKKGMGRAGLQGVQCSKFGGSRAYRRACAWTKFGLNHMHRSRVMS